MHKYLRTYAEINLDAIRANFEALKACVNDETKLCAVIKADGYGHGALTLAEELKNDADYFAVATADEAIELRNGGIKNNILILSYVHSADFQELIEKEISFTLYTLDMALNLNETAAKCGKKALVHIALDTGMGRIGFMPNNEALSDIIAISKLPNIAVQGVFSHYACADMADKSVSEQQIIKFIKFVNRCVNEGVCFPILHLCNSAAISEFPGHFDMVRMGISLYGLYPSDEVDKTKVKLTPAMTFKSHIINIKEVEAGIGISYGHTYKTPSKRKIATVAAGYADGYPRALTNSGRVIVGGKYASVVGRVCMDQFMVDVTGIDVNIDDEVILFGTDGNLTVSAEEIGEKSMSFNYEVVCSVARRCPRVYTKNGKIIKTVNYLR